MEKTRNSNKALDLAIGFFGWLLFSHLVFLVSAIILVFGINKIMSIEQFVSFSTIILWLAALTANLALIVKKRVWIGAGITAAIIINIGIWVVRFQTNVQPAMIIPLPIGMLLQQ